MCAGNHNLCDLIQGFKGKFVNLDMTIEKKEHSVWLGFPENNPSVTDTGGCEGQIRKFP